MKSKVCCFIGHRKIPETEELIERLNGIIENLIKEGVDTFLFGSKSRFDELCRGLVTKAKANNPRLTRVYVRAEYPYIGEQYENYLKTRYDHTLYPDKLLGAGRAVYVERNFEMIRQSDVCVVYFDALCAPKTRKSGTKIALDYAVKQKKRTILLP